MWLHQYHRLRQCQAWWLRQRLSDLLVYPKGIQHRYHHTFHSPAGFLQRI